MSCTVIRIHSHDGEDDGSLWAVLGHRDLLIEEVRYIDMNARKTSRC